MEIEVTRIAPGHELWALFNWKWIGSFQLFFRSWVGFYSWVRELLGINRISIQMLFPFPHLVRTHCSSPEHCIGKPMKARRGWRLEKLKYFSRIYSQSFRQLSFSSQSFFQSFCRSNKAAAEFVVFTQIELLVKVLFFKLRRFIQTV